MKNSYIDISTTVLMMTMYVPFYYDYVCAILLILNIMSTMERSQHVGNSFQTHE